MHRRAAPGARLRLLAARHPRGTAAPWGQGSLCLECFGALFSLLFYFFFSPLRPGPLPTPLSVLAPDLTKFYRCPAVTCPLGSRPALHRGSCPHTWQNPVGAQRNSQRGMEKGNTGTARHIPKERRGRFRPGGAPQVRIMQSRHLLLLCPLPQLFQSSGGGKQRGKRVTVRGAA